MDLQARWRRLRNFFKDARQFLLYLSERFARDNCLRNAATLSYTTLLSIVPLTTVTFSIVAAFPVFDPLVGRIQAFAVANLVPTSGEVVLRYLEEFSSKAAGLTAAGVVGLMISALLMLSAVDRALNEIWHVRQHRRLAQSFLIYWALLTLGPLLIGTSLVMTSYLEALSAYADFGLSLPKQTLLNVAPLAAEWFAFLFMYAVVPNQRVPLRHAAIGAAVAAILFELAKKAFAGYVTSVPTYQAVYGALAALPVFLVWLYVSWTVVLLGAEFTQALNGFRVGRAGALSDPRLRLILAVRLVGHLWYAQRHGRSVNLRGLFRREPRAGEQAIQECLNGLERAKVVLRTEGGAWALARDPGSYTLLDLYQSQSYVLPQLHPNFGERDSWDKQLADVLRDANGGVETALAVPLQRFFAEAGSPEVTGRGG